MLRTLVEVTLTLPVQLYTIAIHVTQFYWLQCTPMIVLVQSMLSKATFGRCRLHIPTFWHSQFHTVMNKYQNIQAYQHSMIALQEKMSSVNTCLQCPQCFNADKEFPGSGGVSTLKGTGTPTTSTCDSVQLQCVM